jgi:hypothetical protein
VSFNFLLNRLNTYPLSRTDKNSELQIINQIARENEYYPTNTTLKIKNKSKINAEKSKLKLPLRKPEDKKWVVFTHTGKETRYITKLFKNTSVKPTFKTANTLKKNTYLPSDLLQINTRIQESTN